MKWLCAPEDIDLDTSVMKCKKRLCGAEFIGIPGLQAAQELYKDRVGAWFKKITAVCNANAFATIGTENNMVVARDENGKAVGFGRTFPDALANVFKRKGLSYAD